MKKNSLRLASILSFTLILLIAGFYFMPLKATGKVTVWFSNHRFEGFNITDAPSVFIVSNITSDDNTINWKGKSLNANVYVGNVSFISLADGIIMWANDSLGVFNFPMVSENDQAFANEIYFSISNVRVYASKEGTKPMSIPYFNHDESSNAHIYVDLDQVESILSIEGRDSYRLSISLIINYYLSVPAPPFLSNSPNKILDEKRVDFGSINVYCNNGSSEYAYVDLPYQEFSYSVDVPYISTLT
jgi:hypothetical protein